MIRNKYTVKVKLRAMNNITKWLKAVRSDRRRSNQEKDSRKVELLDYN